MVSVSPVEGGVPTAGSAYTLECNISRAETLNSTTRLDVVWIDPNNTLILSGTDFNIRGDTSTSSTSLISRLTFPLLRTSQGGIYTCSVNMTIPGIFTNHQVNSTATVTVSSKCLH